MSSFTYKNINVNYTIKGEGSPVILLHGFLGNLHYFDALISSLENHHQVLAIDLLGHGLTENLGYVHSMEDQALMVKALHTHLNLGQSQFIGHSMGGYIALAFAEQFPNDVSQIVLLNSTALADSEEKRVNRDRAIRAVKHNAKTFIKLAIPNLFINSNQKPFQSAIKTLTNEALKTGVQGIVAALEGMKIRPDRSFLYHKKNIQFLVVIGKEDPAIPYQSIVNQIHNTPVNSKEFSGGHMTLITHENEVVKEIEGFINLC